MDPVSSSLASGISATIKIFEVAYQIQAADEQTSDILNTANHVEKNLKEAQRLLRMKAAFLDSDDYEWVESVIRDTRDALQSIAKLIEPARVEKMTRKDISMKTKTYWAFKYNPQARDKHAVLNVYHQTLLVVITRLHSANLPTVLETPDQGTLRPPSPYGHNMEKLWTLRDQRKSRRRSPTTLEHDLNGGPVFIATTDRRELEVPNIDPGSYSTPTSIMHSQRSNPAQEVRNYITDYHHNYPDTPPKPAPSHNEAFELPSHRISSTTPYSNDRWPNASHSNVSLPGSGLSLPNANTRSPYSAYASQETLVAPAEKPQLYEMSAAQPSPEQKLPHFNVGETGQPHMSFDRSTPPRSLPDDSIQPLFASRRSHLTSPSWDSLASAEEPRPSDAGSEPVRRSEALSLAGPLAHQSILEAEGEEGGAVLAPPGGADARRRTGRASMDRTWASGAWSNSSPDLASTRPTVVDRARSTENRNSGGTRLQGSWLAYQNSLRNLRHGREGG